MTCESCHREYGIGDSPWCKDSHAPMKPMIISDELLNFVQENFGDQVEYFDSQKRMEQRADDLGLRPTDRFPAWRGMVTEKRLRDVAALLSRATQDAEPVCETLQLSERIL